MIVQCNQAPAHSVGSGIALSRTSALLQGAPGDEGSAA